MKMSLYTLSLESYGRTDWDDGRCKGGEGKVAAVAGWLAG